MMWSRKCRKGQVNGDRFGTICIQSNFNNNGVHRRLRRWERATHTGPSRWWCHKLMVMYLWNSFSKAISIWKNSFAFIKQRNIKSGRIALARSTSRPETFSLCHWNIFTVLQLSSAFSSITHIWTFGMMCLFMNWSFMDAWRRERDIEQETESVQTF